MIFFEWRSIKCWPSELAWVQVCDLKLFYKSFWIRTCVRCLLNAILACNTRHCITNIKGQIICFEVDRLVLLVYTCTRACVGYKRFSAITGFSWIPMFVKTPVQTTCVWIRSDPGLISSARFHFVHQSWHISSVIAVYWKADQISHI